mgnify:FL=1
MSGAAVVWVVAVWLADGTPAQFSTTEALCREMARNLPEGTPIVAHVDGKATPVRFMACWRAEDGVLKEEIKPGGGER